MLNTIATIISTVFFMQQTFWQQYYTLLLNKQKLKRIILYCLRFTVTLQRNNSAVTYVTIRQFL